MSLRRLLIVEYLCAGFARTAELAPSMLAEGRAMLMALLKDACRIEGTRVAALWNRELKAGPDGDVDLHLTISSEDASESWRRALGEMDAVYLIAPETGRVLRQLCDEVTNSGATLLNCNPAAVDVCGDKWVTYRLLHSIGLPSIPTQLLADARETVTGCDLDARVVLKPRDGCGSEGIRIIPSRTLREVDADVERTVVQPFMPGQPVSVAAVFDDAGWLQDVFPIAMQQLTPDLRYTGGRISTRWNESTTAPDLRRLVDALRTISTAIPGMRGYVGFDLLIEPDGSFVFVEINPRLSTSYIGYRALTNVNLAERWFTSSAGKSPIKWLDKEIEFRADGTIGRATSYESDH